MISPHWLIVSIFYFSIGFHVMTTLKLFQLAVNDDEQSMHYLFVASPRHTKTHQRKLRAKSPTTATDNDHVEPKSHLKAAVKLAFADVYDQMSLHESKDQQDDASFSLVNAFEDDYFEEVDDDIILGHTGTFKDTSPVHTHYPDDGNANVAEEHHTMAQPEVQKTPAENVVDIPKDVSTDSHQTEAIHQTSPDIIPDNVPGDSPIKNDLKESTFHEDAHAVQEDIELGRIAVQNALRSIADKDDENSSSNGLSAHPKRIPEYVQHASPDTLSAQVRDDEEKTSRQASTDLISSKNQKHPSLSHIDTAPVIPSSIDVLNQAKKDLITEKLHRNTSTLPTILLAGAQKGATSALSFWLIYPYSQNKGSCEAEVFDNEPKWYTKEVIF